MAGTKEPIARYDGIYGDSKAQVSHDYLCSQLISPRNRTSDWGLKPHLHGNLFQMFFLEAGQASFQAAAEPVELSTPCLVLIPANTVHGFTFSPQVKGRTLTLSEALMDTILQATPAVMVELNSVYILSYFDADIPFSQLLDLEQQIHTEINSDLPGKQLALNGYFKLLFVKIFRLLQLNRTKEDSPNRALHYFREFQKCIARSAPFEKKISQFAQELKITPVHLNRICQTVKGKSALEIVQAHTVRRAHNLLVYTSLSVSEIAYELQFADAGYFARFFRKQTGLSPMAYRAKAYRGEGQPRTPRTEA
ncbi:AraC family transcriptional regulator, transcriptional activator of pobA [Hymenobacter gelipurpurascens]|uniref:AraC family transcriptional regulator, transcriptional activator of pobA n=1 Tax=Hymenobacter gelipurpurascens TaxID=89968 RepID=A0A212UD35_9BACT|nr:helix-turn-helix domain-containing protein [Hymenobacter gelipurpurascens]SNC76155.1 AraC family transcriptional regulator, transcriptional activator of pobA [Hymenobacter gelipurpurascens]